MMIKAIAHKRLLRAAVDSNFQLLHRYKEQITTLKIKSVCCRTFCDRFTVGLMSIGRFCKWAIYNPARSFGPPNVENWLPVIYWVDPILEDNCSGVLG